jgi:hypothetical protein
MINFQTFQPKESMFTGTLLSCAGATFDIVLEYCEWISGYIMVSKKYSKTSRALQKLGLKMQGFMIENLSKQNGIATSAIGMTPFLKKGNNLVDK